jgi:hypothetical protein
VLLLAALVGAIVISRRNPAVAGTVGAGTAGAETAGAED